MKFKYFHTATLTTHTLENTKEEQSRGLELWFFL
jgi:hypothetical protein